MESYLFRSIGVKLLAENQLHKSIEQQGRCLV